MVNQHVDDGGVMVRVSSLDGVRGLAVLFVLLYHAAGEALGGFLLQSGVDLFFVLSGFLITTILVRTRDRSDYFRLFYGRRAVRIFPLYYLVFTVTLALAWMAIRMGIQDSVGYPKAQNLIDNQMWGWLYQVNNLVAFNGTAAFPAINHLWSLSVEEQFYMVWPLVVLLVPRKRLFSICIGVAVVSMVFRMGSFALVDRDVAYYFTLCRLDGLALGAAGAVVLQTPHLRERFRPWIEWMGRKWWIAFVLLLMPEPVALMGGLTILGLAYLGFVLSAREGTLTERPTRWLNSRFLLELGTYSYAIYVFSFPITAAALTFNPTHIPLVDGCIRVTIVGGLSYGLARVSWVLWEKPWLRLKTRMSYGAGT